jgi:mannose-6-phosphate isomerase-like protein (cupin superfamily)
MHGHRPHDLSYTEVPQTGPTPAFRRLAPALQGCEVVTVRKRPSVQDRRGFIRGVTLASMGGAVALNAAAQNTGPQPVSGGAVIQAGEGQAIPPTADGRQVTVKVDSQLMPGVRMSMVTEDLPPNSAIRVHLHQREDEIIVIRMGSGVATLGDREVTVSAGAIVYVPQGIWHGLRNNGTETLGMSAIYSPPGFEQAFKDRLLRPNRTPAQAEESRKKHGIVYRDPQR